MNVVKGKFSFFLLTISHRSKRFGVDEQEWNESDAHKNTGKKIDRIVIVTLKPRTYHELKNSGVMRVAIGMLATDLDTMYYGT